MAFFTTLKNYTRKLFKQQLDASKTVILGLSGGPDSVFLFHLLKQLHDAKEINLICAHLDHGWRETSSQDALFCIRLCRENNTPIIVRQANNYPFNIKPNGSLEELGREYRRHFFKEVQNKYQANIIALGHHYDDQQETFFIRLLRGSTLTGLTGMQEIDGNYIRPLLHTTKQTILDWLDENKISYLQDPTNNSGQFLRNRIRNHLIPAFKTCDIRFETTFKKTLANLKAEHELLENMTQESFKKVFSTASSHQGNLQKLQMLSETLQKKVLLHWLIQEHVPFAVSSAFINELRRFLSHERGGEHQLNQNWSVAKRKNSFWINKK